MSGREVRINSDGLFKRLHLVPGLAEFTENDTQIEVGFNKFRIDVDRLLIGVYGFLVLAEFGVANPDVIMGLCRRGIDTGNILKCLSSID